MRWEEVWRGDSETGAEIIAGGLRSSGYEARVIGASSPSAWPTLAMNINNWSVVVPVSEAAAARAILARTGESGVSRPAAGIDWRAHLAGLAAVAAILAIGAVVLVVSLVAGR